MNNPVSQSKNSPQSTNRERQSFFTFNEEDFKDFNFNPPPKAKKSPKDNNIPQDSFFKRHLKFLDLSKMPKPYRDVIDNTLMIIKNMLIYALGVTVSCYFLNLVIYYSSFLYPENSEHIQANNA